MPPPSDTAVSVTLTTDERTYLELYTPGTYGVELPSDLAKSMEAKGLVERVLSLDGLRVVVFGGSRLYSITEAGKKALEEIASLRGRLVKETVGKRQSISTEGPAVMDWRKFQSYLEDEYGRLIGLAAQIRERGDHEAAKSVSERASLALMLAHAVDAGLR